MKKTYLVLVGLSSSALVLSSGCLRTRADLQDVDQKKEIKTQLTTLQQTSARDEVRFQDYDGQLRQMYGRIETLEHQLSEAQRQREEAIKSRDMDRTQTEEKMKLYEEALRRLEAQAQQVNQELERQKAYKAAAATAAAASVNAAEKGNYGSADEAFGKKDWKTAIVGFQKYRESNPKGKKYASATYKIGVCFQELGMAADAKSFFEEIIEKFPKAKEAKDAKGRLKSIK